MTSQFKFLLLYFCETNEHRIFVVVKDCSKGPSNSISKYFQTLLFISTTKFFHSFQLNLQKVRQSQEMLNHTRMYFASVPFLSICPLIRLIICRSTMVQTTNSTEFKLTSTLTLIELHVSNKYLQIRNSKHY